MTATLHTCKLQGFLRLLANLHTAEPSEQIRPVGQAASELLVCDSCSLTPGGSNPISLSPLSVRTTNPANSQGFQVNTPYSETLLLPQCFHTQGNPERAAPGEGRDHVGRDHIPTAVGLGHPGMLSRGMSCQVLQVS